MTQNDICRAINVTNCFRDAGITLVPQNGYYNIKEIDYLHFSSISEAYCYYQGFINGGQKNEQNK